MLKYILKQKFSNYWLSFLTLGVYANSTIYVFKSLHWISPKLGKETAVLKYSDSIGCFIETWFCNISRSVLFIGFLLSMSRNFYNDILIWWSDSDTDIKTKSINYMDVMQQSKLPLFLRQQSAFSLQVSDTWFK